MTQRLPFQELQHWEVGESTTLFPGLHYFTLDKYLIVLNDKQGGIKYHYLSLCYDTTWDWTTVSKTNTLSTRPIGVCVCVYIYIYMFDICSREWPEGSFFYSNYTGVGKSTTLFPGLHRFTLDPYLLVLSEEASSTIFWVFDMTWPEIEH